MSYVVRILGLFLLIAETVFLAVYSYYALDRVRSAPGATAGESATVAVFSIIGAVIMGIIFACMACAGTDND